MEKRTIYHFGLPGTAGNFGRDPLLRRMPNGDLACIMLTGGPKEPHIENVGVVSYSTDDGDTWSEPALTFAHGARAVWCRELFAPPTGNPFAIVNTFDPVSYYRELQSFFSFTEDNGRTWSEPRSIPFGVNGATMCQGIVLSNGDWLFPLYWQETHTGFDWTKGPYRAPFRCGVAYSPDNGASFYRAGYICGEYNLWEPCCVELEPGHVVMLMRDSTMFLARSDSYDYGRTWSERQITNIANPSTKFGMTKVGDAVVLVNNFYEEDDGGTRNFKERRIHLQLRVSRDGLQSFDTMLELEPTDERWFYPYIYNDEARRTLYIAYENGAEMRLNRVSYDEIGL